MKRVRGRKNGQGLVEYALILGLVGTVVAGTLLVLGPTIGNVFSGVVTRLQDSAATGGSGIATPTVENCDPCYPTICVPPPPPDLDCADIPYRNFTVVCEPDPHRFDGGHDGFGCEME